MTKSTPSAPHVRFFARRLTALGMHLAPKPVVRNAAGLLDLAAGLIQKCL
jgi:hypothetical protein